MARRRCCGGSRVYYWFCCFYMTILLFILAVFIFWLIFLPQELKFSVTEASLTQFNLSTTNPENKDKNNRLLIYKLSLNITIRNPNKKQVGVYFDRVQVIANYRKKRFAMATLNSTTPFYQGRKNTTVLHSVLEGQQTLSFKEKDDKQYDVETSSGVYSIDVKLALRLRVRFGKIKTAHFKPPKIDCNKLKVPLRAYNGTSGSNVSFKTVKCENIFIFTSRDDGSGTVPF
ncbi:Late embryogenesis abundant protein [Trema orientale]|uniref:Late embryogenesis abundant protein n=1 Tax=Trema orientale TaxID=63057 RepID=A0A2P5EC51_TREOI|nr:Late embryogenesis abundant protein [Trema orientale]